MISEFPFNAVFVKLAIHARELFGEFFRRQSVSSVAIAQLESRKQEFFNLMECMSDYCEIDAFRFHRLILNCFIAFVMLPLARGWVRPEADRSEAQFLFFFGLLGGALSNEELRLLIYRLVFARQLPGKLLELLIATDHSRVESELARFSIHALVESKELLIRHQLHQLYEKLVLHGTEPKSSISFQEVLRERVNFPTANADTLDKSFHLDYTQKTGVVSYLAWSEHLEAFALDDPLAAFEDAAAPSRNTIRVLIFSALEAN